jgi:putative PEP-CTERM system histidine kinase
MGVFLSYAIGALAFFVLCVLMVINRRPQGFGLGVLLACIATTLGSVAPLIQAPWVPAVSHILGTVSDGAWLIVVATVLQQARSSEFAGRWWSSLPFMVGFVSVGCLTLDLQFAPFITSIAQFTAPQVLTRIIIAICGILMVENLYRNTPAGRRWHVFPFCIAVGGLFAYELFVFSEAVVLHHTDPFLLAARGIVLALIAPMLVLTMARNPDWRINVHVSRRVVFHTATFTAGGVFLVLAAIVAKIIGRLPAEWATISEVAFLGGCLIVLLTALSTENIRVRIRRAISENFFSNRYDYRSEWMRCIATLSSSTSGESLGVRIIRALGDVVDSPSGVLWVLGSDGAYIPESTLALALSAESSERVDSALVRALGNGDRVVQFSQLDSRPAWAADPSKFWLAIPLTKVDHVPAFVTLSLSRAPAALSLESFQLLLAVGQQAASYWAEERATRAFMENQSLIEYSKRFSFVIHDIKNVSNSLAMISSNTKTFGDKPEFRADLIGAMDGSIKKLGILVDRLRSNAPEAETTQTVDLVSAVRGVVESLSKSGRRIETEFEVASANINIDPISLEQALIHLITNAAEASAPDDPVTVRVVWSGSDAVVEIIDLGPGMTQDFIRNNLFEPLRSTKEKGHGLGAYQARELIRASGGRLDVISAPGRGTTMRIVLYVPSQNSRGSLRVVSS